MTKIGKLNAVLKYLEWGYTLPYSSMGIAKSEISYKKGSFYEENKVGGKFLINPDISSLFKFVELLPEELFNIINRWTKISITKPFRSSDIYVSPECYKEIMEWDCDN